MHVVHSRMLGLHHLLTGGPDRLTRPDDMHWRVRDDLGLSEGRPSVPQRCLLARLGWGASR